MKMDFTSYPYKHETTLHSFECDTNGKLRLSIAWKYMQEVATDHLLSMGLGYFELIEEGIVFLLSEVSLKIERLPSMREHVTIYTSPTFNKGPRMVREVLFVDDMGELIMEFQTSWVPCDPVTHRLLRPSAFKHEIPKADTREPFCDVTSIKIPVAENKAFVRDVRVTDIDKNNHVNNTVYLDIMADAIGEKYFDMDVKAIHIKYKKEALITDKIELFCDITENEAVVTGKIEGAEGFLTKLSYVSPSGV